MKKKGTPEQLFYRFVLACVKNLYPMLEVGSLDCDWIIFCKKHTTIATVYKTRRHIVVSEKFVRLSDTTKVFILMNLFFQAIGNDFIKSDTLALQIMRKNKFKFDRLRFLQELGSIFGPKNRSKRITNISLNSMIGNSK